MTTFFCPHCWKEIDKNDKLCPYCAYDISTYSELDFEDKLIIALNHPERDTVKRAVWILGKIKSEKAIQHLIHTFEKADDPYLQREIIKSLKQIGTKEAMDYIKQAISSNSVIVKRAALEILKCSDNSVLL